MGINDGRVENNGQVLKFIYLLGKFAPAAEMDLSTQTHVQSELGLQDLSRFLPFYTFIYQPRLRVSSFPFVPIGNVDMKRSTLEDILSQLPLMSCIRAVPSGGFDMESLSYSFGIFLVYLSSIPGTFSIFVVEISWSAISSVLEIQEPVSKLHS